MGFHETQFPDDIAYGSQGGPGYNTNVIVTDSGAEERVARWSEARHQYDAAYGIRTLDQVQTIKKFYVARQGVANGFRFKDFADFTSAVNGRDAHVNTDVEIGTGDASDTTFQLIKKYTDGPTTRNRTITKPVAGTLVISFDDVSQPSGWTVSTTTGIVTFTSAPGAGVSVKAGFEFDVPVRFGEEVDDVLQMTYDSFGSGSIPSIPLIELINEEPVDDEFYFGGAQLVSLVADTAITVTNGRVQLVTPTASGFKLLLPDNTNLKLGGPYFYIINGSGTFTYLLRTSADVAIATIGVNGLITIILGLNASSVKTWYVF